MAKISLVVEVDAAKGTAEIKRFAQESETATKKVGEGAKEGAKGLDTMDASAKKTAKSLSDLLTPANLAAAAIGTALVASLKSALSEASQFADEIHRLQLLTGSSVRNLASLVDVANDVGVEFNAVQMALLRLANASADSDGVLSQFNLTAKDGVGRLVQLAQKLSGVTDETQRVSIVSEIFGARIAAGLLPLMDRLKNGMGDLGAETNDFANILGDDGVTALRNFGIAQGQVGDALLALKIVVAKDLLPVMGPLVAMTEQMVKWFYAVPAPVRAAVEVLGLAAGAIAAVNLALRLFGITTLAMSGPAGWIALAVAGIAVLVTSLEGLGSKLTSLWTDFKNRGMTPAPAPAAGAAAGASSGTPPQVILPKEVVEANDAIKKQIETLKSQKIELEQGAIAALKYSLAHGEMAKASPALKAQLIALTQGVQNLKTEQEVAADLQAMLTADTNEATAAIRANVEAIKAQNDEIALSTVSDAIAEIKQLTDAENALKAAMEKANDERAYRNLLMIDDGTTAETVAERTTEAIQRIKELLQWEQERIALMVKLKQLSPHEAAQQESAALNDAIATLKRYKTESLSAYGPEAQVVKDVDREVLKLTADQKTLTDEMLTFGGAMSKAFDGVMDVLSLFGIKVGKFILMLQQLPRVMSGFEKIGKGLSGIFNLLSSGGQGATASQGGGASGLFSMFGGFLGMGGSNPAASVLQWGAAPAGSSATLGAPMMAGQAGGMSGLMGMLGPAALSAGIGYTIGSMLFGKSGGIGAGLGAGIGSLFGPAGALIGGLGGGLLGKIFGGLFGSTPKGKLKANILPFDLDALTSGALRDLDTAVKGTRVGAISVNVKGNVYKTSKEHKLEEEFARALNDLFIDMVKGIEKLIPELPKMVGAELDAALQSLSETGLQFEKFSKSGSKAKKKLKKHLENLPNAMIEAVVEDLGFGKLDLKLMGGGDAAKGFEGLLDALGGMSAVLKRVTGSTDSFSGTLEEFTDKSIEFFENFRRSGESFTDTVARVNQGFASLFGVMDQLSLDIGTSAGAGFEGLVEVYQRSVDRIQELADAGLVAVESGASPDEIAAAAQALRDAMQVSQDVLQRIAEGLQRLNAAVVTGVDLYADMEIRIRALDGAAMAVDELIDAAYRLAVGTHNIGSQISIFEAVLRVVGTDFTSFTAALPRLSSAFGELLDAIRNTASNAEAVTQLQALAQAVVNGAQAVYQGIANGATQARDAAQTASDARIRSLEDERAAIQDVAEEQREANQAQLDAIRQWKSIAESAKAQLVDLFNLLAPTHPEAAFNEVLAQFRSAVSGFGPKSTPETAIQIQELAKQVLQLAQGVPGMDLPSLAFQTLAAEVKAALEAVQTVAENQPTEADILGQIVISTDDNGARLAEIDAAIRAEQDNLQQTLQLISANEQQQIATANEQQTAALTMIREHLGARLMALQAEQEAARAILTQITGDLSFEAFIASKQAESVVMLGQIRDVLKDYLGTIVAGLGFSVPALAEGGVVMPRPGGTIVRLAEAGYPEMVTPMHGGSVGGSGGQQIVISPQITVYADQHTDGQKVGKAIVREIKEAILYGELNSTVQKVAGRR